MKVPNIDYSLCTGCGGCAEAFPQFFELRDEKAWVINAGKMQVASRSALSSNDIGIPVRR